MANYPVNIDPSFEETTAILKLYQAEDAMLSKEPLKPKKRTGILSVLLTITVLLCGILFFILRLPLKLIKRLRLIYIKDAERAEYRELYEHDPDEADDEFVFEEPDKKLTPLQKKQRRNEEERKQRVEKMKADWLNDPLNHNLLMDYAILESVREPYNGNMLALYILHGLREMPHSDKLNDATLYWNLGAVTSKLDLHACSRNFMHLAIEKGFNVEAHQKSGPRRKGSGPGRYLWDLFYQDLINCWPS